MQTKIKFAVDFLQIFRTSIIFCNPVIDNFTDSVSRFFLMLWKFTPEEIDYANIIFRQNYYENKLDNNSIVIQRMINHFRNHPSEKEKFLEQFLCVTMMSKNVTQKQLDFMQSVCMSFDVDEAKFQGLLESADHLSQGIFFMIDKFNNRN